jgi:hypothetical protein
MSRSLRETHLRIWMVLAAILAAIFTTALIIRKPSPPQNPGLFWERYR